MVKGNKMNDSCSIIIPAIDINQDVKKCIKECLSQKNINLKIFLITNKKIINPFKSRKVKCLSYGDITMSKKRNKAVKKSKDKFIAFIDSDAYPAKKWIFNGIKILKNKPNVGIVSGPELPVANQKGWINIISLAHNSILLSGSKAFYKNSKKEVFCEQTSSCNMIMKKNVYKLVGGMDEKIYIGEDKDLCDKISKYFNILYSPKVVVYHKTRDFIPFILQRFSYGTCIFDIIKNNKKFSFNNFQYFIPMFIVLYLILLPVSLFNNILIPFFLIILIALNLIILIECLKITLDPIKFLKIFSIFYISIISFGLGSVLYFLNDDNIKKIYTKR